MTRDTFERWIESAEARDVYQNADCEQFTAPAPCHGAPAVQVFAVVPRLVAQAG